MWTNLLLIFYKWRALHVHIKCTFYNLKFCLHCANVKYRLIDPGLLRLCSMLLLNFVCQIVDLFCVTTLSPHLLLWTLMLFHHSDSNLSCAFTVIIHWWSCELLCKTWILINIGTCAQKSMLTNYPVGFLLSSIFVWIYGDMSQLLRIWYLSHRRPAKAQSSLRIRKVPPEPSRLRGHTHNNNNNNNNNNFYILGG